MLLSPKEKLVLSLNHQEQFYIVQNDKRNVYQQHHSHSVQNEIPRWFLNWHSIDLIQILWQYSEHKTF